MIPEARRALTLIEKKKAREREGLFVVEGDHLVLEAGKDIEYILFSDHTPAVESSEKRGVPAYKISHQVMEKLTSVETPQGVLAVVKKRSADLADMFKNESPLIVFLDRLQDPGNLGTIIRSADAAGAAGVITSRGTVEVYNQKVVRSTMGSLFHLPVIEDRFPEDILPEMKKRGLRVIGAEAKGDKKYFEADLSKACTIIIGNEGAGLSPEVIKHCDETVAIPMRGKSESLNAAMAASVIIFEVMRQRWSKE